MKTAPVTWTKGQIPEKQEAMRTVGFAFWKTLTHDERLRLYFIEEDRPNEVEQRGNFNLDAVPRIIDPEFPLNEWDSFFIRMSKICPHCQGTGRIE